MMIFVLLVLSYEQVNSQFDFGVSFGLSTMDVSAEELKYSITDHKKFTLATEDARYGIQIGAFATMRFNTFFIMPEAYLHSKRYAHHIQEFNGFQEVIETVRYEDLHSFDVALLMGKQWGFFRLGAGPVCSMFLDNVSQLWAEEGYDQAWDTATWGAQLGAGLDILMIHLDLRYQMDLEQFGDHISFFGEKAEHSPYAGRWSLRLGYSF